MEVIHDQKLEAHQSWQTALLRLKAGGKACGAHILVDVGTGGKTATKDIPSTLRDPPKESSQELQTPTPARHPGPWLEHAPSTSQAITSISNHPPATVQPARFAPMETEATLPPAPSSAPSAPQSSFAFPPQPSTQAFAPPTPATHVSVYSTPGSHTEMEMDAPSSAPIVLERPMDIDDAHKPLGPAVPFASSPPESRPVVAARSLRFHKVVHQDEDRDIQDISSSGKATAQKSILPSTSFPSPPSASTWSPRPSLSTPAISPSTSSVFSSTLSTVSRSQNDAKMVITEQKASTLDTPPSTPKPSALPSRKPLSEAVRLPCTLHSGSTSAVGKPSLLSRSTLPMDEKIVESPSIGKGKEVQTPSTSVKTPSTPL